MDQVLLMHALCVLMAISGQVVIVGLVTTLFLQVRNFRVLYAGTYHGHNLWPHYSGPVVDQGGSPHRAHRASPVPLLR